MLYCIFESCWASRNHSHRKPTNLITWTTDLSNLMKLWALLCRATQDGQIVVECSDKKWSAGDENGKSLQYSCLENPMKVWKGKKIGHWTENSPGWQVPNMLLEISGEIPAERMKRQTQRKNNTQLWMWVVTEVKSNAVKSNIALEPGIRSMNQGKLEVVKQEMARVNIDILGINELKWTRMAAFNSDDRFLLLWARFL